MTVLVTGVAGFIGSHVARALLDRGDRVVGVDDLNAYYDVSLKRARLARLTGSSAFSFFERDVSDREGMEAVRAAEPGISGIVHLAAQAGVRHSLVDPYAYVRSNVMGHLTMLELARRLDGLRRFVYASSSSVYGSSAKLPFVVGDPVDAPRSLYAATKRADEMMSDVYVHTHGLTLTGLRFFTVYGPWGRPDMAPWIFARSIFAGERIEVFNLGLVKRDFSYVDDVVDGVLRAYDRAGERPGHALYNLGASRGEDLMRFIALLERAIGKGATIDLQPAQLGDVPETAADIEATRRDLGWSPKTPIEEGVPRFVDWFRDYHRL